MARLLVTGGTGFLGKELVKSFKDDELLMLSRNGEIKVDLSEFKISEEDLNKIKSASEIYHLGAMVSLSDKSKDKIIEVNVEGTRRLLEAVKDTKPLFWYFSTAYACGITNSPVKEDTIKRPDSFRCAYEESKWLAESIVRRYHDEYNIPYIIIRPSIILNDVSNENADQTIYLFAKMLKNIGKKRLAIKGDPKSTLNFTTISHIVESVNTIRRSGVRNMTFNLVNKENTNAETVLEMISKGLGKDAILSMNGIAIEPFTKYLMNGPKWETGAIKRAKGKVLSIRPDDLITRGVAKWG